MAVTSLEVRGGVGRKRPCKWRVALVAQKVVVSGLLELASLLLALHLIFQDESHTRGTGCDCWQVNTLKQRSVSDSCARYLQRGGRRSISCNPG